MHRKTPRITNLPSTLKTILQGIKLQQQSLFTLTSKSFIQFEETRKLWSSYLIMGTYNTDNLANRNKIVQGNNV